MIRSLQSSVALHGALGLGLLAACGHPGSKANDSEPMDRVGIENGVALLGQSYESRSEDFRAQCVTSGGPDSPVEVVYSGAPTSAIDLKKVTSWEDLHALLDVQVSGKLKYPSFNLTGAARFVSDAKATKSSYSMVYSAGIRGKNALVKSPVLSRDAIAAKATLDDETIRRQCGDSYVGQVELGAQYLVQVRFDFANAQAKSEFDAKLRFEYLNLFEVEGAAKVLSENAKKNASISISALQVGGDVEKLLGVLGVEATEGEPNNYAVLDCAIDNAAACIKTLQGFLAYASDTETGFPGQLKKLKYDTTGPGGAAVLGYVTVPYENGSSSTRTLYEAPPPTLGAAVRDARAWLGSKYDELAVDARKADALRRLYLTEEQDGLFRGIQARIAKSTSALLEVVGICYSDLDKCALEQSALKSLLADDNHAYKSADLSKKYTFVDYCRVPGNDAAAATTVEAIKAALGRSNEEDCLKLHEDLQAMSVLEIKNAGITDVRPFRGLTRLRNIDLRGNEIRNASPLFELDNLRRLTLRSNAISALDGIEALKALQVLDVAHNQVDDATPFLSLGALEELRAHGNRIPETARSDSRWAALAGLRHRSLTDGEACSLGAATVVARGELGVEAAQSFLDLGMGPLFQRDGDPTSSLEGWGACDVSAKFL